MATLKVPVTQHDHIRGPVNAPVTLVEYGDYECPYCGLAHPIVNAVRERFPRQLRVRLSPFSLQSSPSACRSRRRDCRIRWRARSVLGDA